MLHKIVLFFPYDDQYLRYLRYLRQIIHPGGLLWDTLTYTYYDLGSEDNQYEPAIREKYYMDIQFLRYNRNYRRQIIS